MQNEINLSSFNNDKNGIIEKYQSHLINNGNDWDLHELSQDTLDLFYALDEARIKAKGSLEKYKQFIIEEIEEKEANDKLDYKLHELSYHVYKNSDRIREVLKNTSLGEEFDIFYDFCDLEWNCYQEWLKEQRIDLNRITQYIGRSSKFYLTYLQLDTIAERLIENNCNNSHGMYYTLYDGDLNDNSVSDLFDILDDVISYHSDFFEYLDSEHEEISIQNTIKAIIEDYEEIENFIDYTKNDYYVMDSLEVFNYIQDFKNNAIESFEFYLADFEEMYPKDSD